MTTSNTKIMSNFNKVLVQFGPYTLLYLSTLFYFIYHYTFFYLLHFIYFLIIILYTIQIIIILYLLISFCIFNDFNIYSININEVPLDVLYTHILIPTFTYTKIIPKLILKRYSLRLNYTFCFFLNTQILLCILPISLSRCIVKYMHLKSQNIL